MAEIPEDIMRKAREIVDHLDNVSDRYRDDPVADRIRARYAELKSKNDFTTSSQISRAEFIAAALIAEREEATRVERERCAAVCSEMPTTTGLEKVYVNRIMDGWVPSNDFLRTPSERESVRKTIREGKGDE